ncbi:hypothetical protein JKP88DRAFT_240941 [Tribonema minus]|uniref:Uncharacterized protein n=1 Tax=Tribonema minus TaxID=303371 RepID=A0A836CH42_9STRA|nr:hypothetical protein JKP88DRAFT_240941 [Tribonema minus]
MDQQVMSIMLDANLLEHVQQQWYPTTGVVCTDWHKAHLRDGLPLVALPDDTYELKDALQQGMPFTSAAIVHVCRQERMKSLCSVKDVLYNFEDVERLLTEFADIKDSKCAPLFEEYWYHYIFYTEDIKYSALSTLDYLLNEHKERVLEHDIFFIARAVARIPAIDTLDTVVCYFRWASCHDESHFNANNDLADCDCDDDRIRTIFAQAILDTECEDEEMLEWAYDVLYFDEDDEDGEDDGDEQDNDDMDT